MYKVGDYEFQEGDRIYIGAYIFEIRHGDLMLQWFSVAGGLCWKDFEDGIFLLLLQNVPNWIIAHPREL